MVRKLKNLTAEETKETQDVFAVEDSLVKEAVQTAAELDAVIKHLKKELESTKAWLKQTAKENGETELTSEAGDRLKISPTSTTIVESVIAFVQLLKKLDKQHLINDLLKVEISKVKKILGEDVLEDISETKTEKYGKMKFTMAARDLSEVKRKYLE